MWRKRGLALDKALPHLFRVPAPAFADFDKFVPRVVQTGDGSRRRLEEADVQVVVTSASDVCDFMAAHLPCQIVDTDLKRDLPNSVSSLVVRCADGSEEYVGSFDFLEHVFVLQTASPRPVSLDLPSGEGLT